MINLASQSCVHLLFSCQTALITPVLEQIRTQFNVNLSGRRRRGFHERAAVDRRVEHLQVSFSGQPGPASTFEIEFHYDAETLKRGARTVSHDFAKGAALLKTLSSLPQEVEFECGVSFEYGPPAAEKLFPVGLGSPEQADRAFDEIRGLTAVKLEDGEAFYTVALESFDLETLSVYVTFKHTGSFSATLPARLLQRAVSISSRFSE